MRFAVGSGMLAFLKNRAFENRAFVNPVQCMDRILGASKLSATEGANRRRRPMLRLKWPPLTVCPGIRWWEFWNLSAL
jgi:hypothetical protein